MNAPTPEEARQKVVSPLDSVRPEVSGELTLAACAAWVRAAAVEK